MAVAFLTDPVEPVRNPWVQEYEPGAEGMVGQVDKAALEQVSPDFAIGADDWGRAVFKEPYKAFDTFVKLYAEPLERIQKAFDLPAITRREYKDYLLYGWQLETDNEEQRQQNAFGIAQARFRQGQNPLLAIARVGGEREIALLLRSAD